jgi:hypothetical protein
MLEVSRALLDRFNTPLPEHIDPFYDLLVGLHNQFERVVLPLGAEVAFWDSGKAVLRSDAFLRWIDVFGTMDTAIDCVQTARRPLSQEVLGMAL